MSNKSNVLNAASEKADAIIINAHNLVNCGLLMEAALGIEASFFRHCRHVLMRLLAKDIRDRIKRKAVKGLFREFINKSWFTESEPSDSFAPSSLRDCFRFNPTPEGYDFWLIVHQADEVHRETFVMVETLLLLSDISHRERQKALRESRRLAKAYLTYDSLSGLFNAFNWADSKYGVDFWQDITAKVAKSNLWEKQLTPEP